MSGYVYLNGTIVRAEEARISPLDRGFLFGDGLFETMRAYGGTIHLLRRHLDRLEEGASTLGIALPPRGTLVDALRAMLSANDASDAVLRLTVSRGVGAALRPAPAGPSTILITLRPLLQSGVGASQVEKSGAGSAAGKLAAEKFDSEKPDSEKLAAEKSAVEKSCTSESSAGKSGMKESYAETSAVEKSRTDESSAGRSGGKESDVGKLDAKEPDAGESDVRIQEDVMAGVGAGSGNRMDAPAHVVVLRTKHIGSAAAPAVKSLSYLPSVLGSIELEHCDAPEGIMMTDEGFVAEGTVSNLFCVVDSVVWTPPVELGILSGVTRGRVLELAGEIGIERSEAPFDLSFMKSAAECFYTNSVRELVSIGSIDGQQIGDGAIGPVTARLLELYRGELPDEDL